MTRRRTIPRPIALLLLALLLAALVGGPRLYLELKRWPHIPTNGAMLHPFGVPVDYQSCGFHTGQDWFAPVGTPVFAIEDASVVYLGPLWLDGPGVGRGPHSLILFHAEGNFYTTYSHNARSLVAVGDTVRRGQQIAEVGDQGYSPSPHLHLERVEAAYSGDWRQPFVGCDGYSDPGSRWSPF